MSNARSPRDVCSTTIGIRGMSLLLAAGGPQLLRLLLRFLLGSPDALPRLFLLRRDRLDVGRDPVDRLLEAEIGADAVGTAARDELLDVIVALALLAELRA